MPILLPRSDPHTMRCAFEVREFRPVPHDIVLRGSASPGLPALPENHGECSTHSALRRCGLDSGYSAKSDWPRVSTSGLTHHPRRLKRLAASRCCLLRTDRARARGRAGEGAHDGLEAIVIGAAQSRALPAGAAQPRALPAARHPTALRAARRPCVLGAVLGSRMARLPRRWPSGRSERRGGRRSRGASAMAEPCGILTKQQWRLGGGRPMCTGLPPA